MSLITTRISKQGPCFLQTVVIKTRATRPFLGNGSRVNQLWHTANVLIAADVEEICLLLC